MVNILDCTIRDGSYATHNHWSAQTLQDIVSGLSVLGIRYIEIGNGTGLGTYRNTKDAMADDAYYENTIPYKGDSLIGAFFIPGIGTKDDLRRFREVGGDFVRIGANPTDIEKTVEYIEYAKSLGFWVTGNLMKTYAISVYQMAQKAHIMVQAGVDCVYIVDSAGGMLPDRVGQYVDAILGLFDVEVGFHGHNNLMMANANSLSAVQHGAKLVDASIMSLGRGAGNAQLETLVAVLQRAGYMDNTINVLELADFGERVISHLLSGPIAMSKRDIAVGTAYFHDSYMPSLMKVSEKYHVDPDVLITEVSKVNMINPSEELFEVTASRLAEGKHAIHFPKFSHQVF